MPRSPAFFRSFRRTHACVALAALAACALGPARARADALAGGTITVYANVAVGSCTLADLTEDPFDVYVLALAPARLGARFRLAVSAGMTATHVSTVIHAPSSTGDIFTGIEVGYGLCVVTDYLIATVTYQGHGTSEPCSSFEVAPHPSPITGAIDMKDCNNAWLTATTEGALYVNPDVCLPWCSVPVEDSTWGRVKALYRN